VFTPVFRRHLKGRSQTGPQWLHPLLRDAPSGVAYNKDLDASRRSCGRAAADSDLWRVRKLSGGSAVVHIMEVKQREKSQAGTVTGNSGALIS
jgi:hypothetical protein